MNLLKPRHARWMEFLSQFQFKIVHIAGASNVVADFLSRSFEFQSQKIQDIFLNSNQDGSLTVNINVTEAEDHDWPEDVAAYLDSEDNRWPCTLHSWDDYKDEIQKFKVIGDKLYYVEDQWSRLFLPSAQRKDALVRVHDHLAHLGFSSVIDLLKRRYYWPTMNNDLKEYIASCSKCQLARGAMPPALPLTPIPPVAHPFERWGIDFLQNLPTTRLGNANVITCIDYATRWVVAEPVKDMSAETVVKFLYKRIFMEYGVPFEIVSDRGQMFLSEMVQQFLSSYAVKHLPSSSYHPQTNGMVESMHRMINHAVRTSIDKDRTRWDEEFDKIIYSLRVRTHSVTQFSPYMLVFGIQPRLLDDNNQPPIQVRAPWDDEEVANINFERTVTELENLGQARAAAYKRSLAQAARMKGNNDDSNGFNFKFQINDWVKRRNFNSLKFQNVWSGPYYVVEHGYPGTYRLMKPDGTMIPNLVNESHLKAWISRDSDDERDVFQEADRLEEVPDDLERGTDDSQQYAPAEEGDNDNV
jgi:transposase InsO family protein